MVHSILFIKGDVLPRFEAGRIHYTDPVNGEYPNERRTDTDWGLVPSNASFVQAPEYKEYIMEVDGADNDGLDYTDAMAGRPLYKSRQGEWTFYRKSYMNWRQNMPEIVNWLQGKKVSIIVDDDPCYYYTGRVSVSYESNEYWAVVTMRYKLEAYKKYVYPSYQLDVEEETVLSPFTKKIYPIIWDLIDFEDVFDEQRVILERGLYIEQGETYDTYRSMFNVISPWRTLTSDDFATGDITISYGLSGYRAVNPLWSSISVDRNARDIKYDGEHINYLFLNSIDFNLRGRDVSYYFFSGSSSTLKSFSDEWFLFTVKVDSEYKYRLMKGSSLNSSNIRRHYVNPFDDYVEILYALIGDVWEKVYSVRRLDVVERTYRSAGVFGIPAGSIIGYFDASTSRIEYVTQPEANPYPVRFILNYEVMEALPYTGATYDYDSFDLEIEIDDEWVPIYIVLSAKLEIPEKEKPVVPRISVICDGEHEDPDLLETGNCRLIHSETNEIFACNNLDNYEAYQLKAGIYSVQELYKTPPGTPGILLDWRNEKL